MATGAGVVVAEVTGGGTFAGTGIGAVGDVARVLSAAADDCRPVSSLPPPHPCNDAVNTMVVKILRNAL
ncbi:MAG: hypothetical protein E6Q76_07735 [Rhizobium sp.]|nr:MAG: hypothetical protein E6Q76_07735 [Rhizobium sp.]